MNLDWIETEARDLFGRARELALKMPAEIIFAAGGLSMLHRIVRADGWGSTALVVTGSNSASSTGLRGRLDAALQECGLECVAECSVSHEPIVVEIDAAAAYTRETNPSCVVALGGGSVIDTAKVLTALAVNPGAVTDYLEGIGQGWTLTHEPLPLIAIPTTSGTGAEMTKNGVIADHDRGFKRSMRDERMIPRVALLDPDLTVSVPQPVTAAGGMDAITQLIEPCISAKRTPATTELAHRALRGAGAALSRCCTAPQDRSARARMALASGASGICLANAGLALAHGIASGLGGLQPVPHGLICGILLPHVLHYNRDACDEPLAAALAAFLNEDGVSNTTIDRGVEEIRQLNREVGVPADLKHLRLDDAQVHRVAEASQGSSMTGNPIPMTPALTYEFLTRLT